MPRSRKKNDSFFINGVQLPLENSGTTRGMESKQRYRNFLLSVKTDKAEDVAKERCGYIEEQIPRGIRYAIGNIVRSGPGTVLYIAISFAHGRYLGGLQSEFPGWTSSGFSNISDACEHTPNGAEQVFVVGDIPRQGKCKPTGVKKRTWDELEEDNQVLRECNNHMVNQLSLVSEAHWARERDLVKQLKQASETIKARETAGVRFLDEYLGRVAPSDLLEVLNTVEMIVNPSSSRPRLATKREAFLRHHPDKQNSKYGVGKDQEWNTRVSGVVCRHLNE